MAWIVDCWSVVLVLFVTVRYILDPRCVPQFGCTLMFLQMIRSESLRSLQILRNVFSWNRWHGREENKLMDTKPHSASSA